MRITDWLSRCVAFLLTLTLVFATTPVSAADLTGTSPVLGVLSGAGSVQVRGVVLQKETTLFEGDRVRTGPGAYASLNMANGTRVEVAGNTDLVVKRDGEKGIRLNLVSGTIALTASKDPLSVAMNGQEEVVYPKAGSKVNVGLLPSADMADVRVLSGSVEVKSTSGKSSVAIAAGSERMVNLKTGSIELPVVQIASATPAAAPRAGMPAAAPPPSLGPGMLAMVGTLVGATAVIVLMSTRAVVSDISASQRVQQQVAIQSTASIIATANAAITAAAQVSTSSGLIATASPSNSVEANAIAAAATSTQADINALNSQLANLSAQLSATTDPIQLNSLVGQVIALRDAVNSKVATLNGQIAQLNALSKKTGVTIPQINDVPQNTASPS